MRVSVSHSLQVSSHGVPVARRAPQTLNVCQPGPTGPDRNADRMSATATVTALDTNSRELIETEVLAEPFTIDLCGQCGRSAYVADMTDCAVCGYVCMVCATKDGCPCPVQ